MLGKYLHGTQRAGEREGSGKVEGGRWKVEGTDPKQLAGNKGPKGITDRRSQYSGRRTQDSQLSSRSSLGRYDTSGISLRNLDIKGPTQLIVLVPPPVRLPIEKMKVNFPRAAKNASSRSIEMQ